MARPSKLRRALSRLISNLSFAVFLPPNTSPAQRVPVSCCVLVARATMQATPALRDALLGDLQSWRWVLSCRLSTVSHQWRLLCREHHATLRELTLSSCDDACAAAMEAGPCGAWPLRTITLECGELRKLDLASVPLSYPGAAILAVARGCPHLVHLSLASNCLASVFGSLNECLGQQLEHLELGPIGLDEQEILSWPGHVQRTTWPVLRHFGISGLGTRPLGLPDLATSPLRMTCPALEELRIDDSEQLGPYPFSSYVPFLFTTGATSPSPLKILKLIADEDEHRPVFSICFYLKELLGRFPLLNKLEISGVGPDLGLGASSEACSRLLVEAISQCQALTVLDLGWTHIFIDDFATLFRLPRLRELDLTGIGFRRLQLHTCHHQQPADAGAALRAQTQLL